MRPASAYQRALGILAFFTLAAGDFWRYLLSWWGWGAIAALSSCSRSSSSCAMRVDVRRLPLTLLAFLGFAVLSIIWSAYPGGTAVGLVVTFATTDGRGLPRHLLPLGRRPGPVSDRPALDHRPLARCSSSSSRSPSSSRCCPFWVDYSDLEKIPAAFYWSRNLLFEGGRIQGIVGNSNLLGMLGRASRSSCSRCGWWLRTGLAAVGLVLARARRRDARPHPLVDRDRRARRDGARDRLRPPGASHDRQVAARPVRGRCGRRRSGSSPAR